MTLKSKFVILISRCARKLLCKVAWLVKKMSNWKKLKYFQKKYWLCYFNLIYCVCASEKEAEWSLKTEQNVNSLLARKNNSNFKIYFFGEFDPGSGWTLAACLRHASRTKWPNNDWVLAQSLRWNFHLVADGWVTRK